MKPERWKQIDELLEAALDCPPAERAAFLDRACAGDDGLRREVESLLCSDAQAANFIEAPALEAAIELLGLAAGQQISHYQIVSMIGSGGMGTVYLAQDTSLGRKVALKVLPPHFTADREHLRRFEQEAFAASSLSHPNILVIHEIGSEGDTHFIATEYVEGETLRQRLARGRMSLREALDVAIQAANALVAAHAAGIIHRDIKPENIMLRADGYVKVLDFGLAKQTRQQPPAPDTAVPTVAMTDTKPGIIMGTINYMSPEQARGLPVDARADIFSLGVVLYEMATGQQPFTGQSGADALAAILQKEPEPLTRHAPEAPVDLQRIVGKCMEKNRDRRYQATRDLLLDLKNLAPAISTESTSTKLTPSIAVLPFVNMSADPDNEYFCDGLAEDLLNALAKIEDLRVAARTSAFSFKGKDADVREIGQKLNVTVVLEGSVRRSGSRLRVTAQLINVADGYHLWSERYDRHLEDVFDIQDEITAAIVEALKAKLLGGTPKHHTENTEAYELYLKGLYHYNKQTVEGFRKAVEFFEQAVAVDPNYALAYAVLADTYGYLLFYGSIFPHEALPKITSLLEKALELDDNLAEAHRTKAKYEFHYAYNFPAAGREYRKALELNPNSAEARIFYSRYLSLYEKRLAEAIAEGERALELDPLSLLINLRQAQLFLQAGHYDRALKQARRLLELEPNFYGAYWMRGAVHAREGRYEEAIAELNKAVSLGGGPQLVVAHLGHVYGAAKNREKALEVIEELQRLRTQGYALAYQVAIVYAGLGDKDRALECLEQAYEERNVSLSGLQAEPFFESLRAEPRFQGLARRVGLPQ